MKFEDQVTSLELSRRLKELGVKQESLFYWTKYTGEWTVDMGLAAIPSDHEEGYSAFTVAELGELLPDYVTFTQRRNRTWYVGWNNADLEIYPEVVAETEAEARGKMLVHLLENNLLSPKETPAS